MFHAFVILEEIVNLCKCGEWNFNLETTMQIARNIVQNSH